MWSQLTNLISNAKRRPLSLIDMTDAMGDCTEFKHHDIAFKYWLPEPVAEAIKQVAESFDMNVSSCQRYLLARHVYGLYPVMLVDKRARGTFISRRSDAILFSKSYTPPPKGKVRKTTYWVPELGKNIVPVKVWMAHRLKDDLQKMADHVGIPLSQYTREAMISDVLGHGTLPYRPSVFPLCVPNEAVAVWETISSTDQDEQTLVATINHRERTDAVTTDQYSEEFGALRVESEWADLPNSKDNVN